MTKFSTTAGKPPIVVSDEDYGRLCATSGDLACKRLRWSRHDDKRQCDGGRHYGVQGTLLPSEQW